MEIIFLLGSVQAFFFATLFFSRRQITLPHRLLIIFFILIGVLLLDHFLELKGISFDYPHLLGLAYTLPLVLGPIIFYYTLVLIREGKQDFKRLYWLHFLPFVLLTVYFLFDYYLLTAAEKLRYYHRESEENTSVVIYFTEFLLNVSIPSYSILSLFYLKKHIKNIKSRFSYTDDISLQWLSTILYFFVGLSVLSLLTNLLSDIVPVISFWMGDNLSYGALAISVFFIGYYGIRQKAIYWDNSSKTSEPMPSNRKKQYHKSGLKIEESDGQLARLLTIMKEEKLHRNSKLSLKELADKMNLSENNLSQLINEGLGKSFYDFVNAYRLEDVKSMLKNPKYDHYSLLGIALECGFNSKSSFNNIFKQQTGVTPSEFKNLQA